MRGGGVAIIEHNSIRLNDTPLKIKNFSSFKCIGSVIISSHSTFKLLVIYRPSLSSISKFFTELASLLECHTSSSIDLFFLGDFNIKIESFITTLKIFKNCYKILVCLSMPSLLHIILVIFSILLLKMCHLNLISVHFVLRLVSLTTKQFVLILTLLSRILRTKMLLNLASFNSMIFVAFVLQSLKQLLSHLLMLLFIPV